MSLSRKGFYLVNTSRGGVVCEDSFVKCLDRTIIKGGALDVFEEEPLHPKHPLRQYNNVILTNHIIGHSKDLFDSLPSGVVKSINTILERNIPENCINVSDIAVNQYKKLPRPSVPPKLPTL